MVTMRALPPALPAGQPPPLPPDRRDDVLDTALATSEGVQCLDERHMWSASSFLLLLAAEVAEADDRLPPPRTAERARKRGIYGSC